MISYLNGKTIFANLESATIDVNGVGYEVFCSQNTLDQLVPGQAAKVYIFTHVREDAFVLYGFSTPQEKELFLSLIKVNGVGPKLAIKILSATTVDHFLSLIDSGDVGGLSKIPKVGKKTAEQLVLTLKGKLEFSDNAEANGSKSKMLKEITSALVNLGFKEADVQKVVQNMPPDTNFEEGLRKGLSTLSNG